MEDSEANDNQGIACVIFGRTQDVTVFDFSKMKGHENFNISDPVNVDNDNQDRAYVIFEETKSMRPSKIDNRVSLHRLFNLFLYYSAYRFLAD